MKNLFSAPDNVNKKTVIFFIGILLFWYSTCVISGLTGNRFLFLSNVLLNILRAFSTMATICVLVIIFFMLVLAVFYKTKFRLVYKYVLWGDVALSLIVISTVIIFQGSTSYFAYYYSFFSPVIPQKTLESVLSVYNESTIGRVYYLVFLIGLGGTMYLGENILDSLKGAEENGKSS